MANVIWDTLDRARAHIDPGDLADLVLRLLYVRIREPRRWASLLDESKKPRSGQPATELLRQWRVDVDLLTSRPAHTLQSATTESIDRDLFEKIVELVDTIRPPTCFGSDPSTSPWLWARLFRALLHRFVREIRRNGAEFLTPDSLVQVMVGLVTPQQDDSIYDPCCGSGDLLVGAADYLSRRGRLSPDHEIFGQAMSERSFGWASMNLSLYGCSPDLGTHPATALRENLHSDRRFDIILTNPPFNASHTENHEQHDPRWVYGVPPESNDNFAWLQHVVTMLTPRGRGAILMANGASSSGHPRERAIREAMIDAGVVEGLVALPPQLFTQTMIPVTLWLLRSPGSGHDDDILFIDATSLGAMTGRVQRVLATEDIEAIIQEVDKWRRRSSKQIYEGVAGFSRSVDRSEIHKSGDVLNPRMYVSSANAVADLTEAAEKVSQLHGEVLRLQALSAQIDSRVEEQLSGVGPWKP